MKIIFISFTFLAAVLSFVPGYANTAPRHLQKKASADKILSVRVNETGTISIGRDTVGSDELARYIQERLFKSYLGTGQMQNRIKLVKENNDVPDMVVEVVTKEIQEGQRRALTEVSLQKYRTQFENIDKKKQAKLKKQFPVLFQTDYL
jgi:predicted Zn-dependent protease